MKARKMNAKKWHGMDASNETSLFEYGLLFRQTKDGLQVIYKWYGSDDQPRYSYGWFDSNDFKPENTCLNIEDVCSYSGSTLEMYENNPEQFCSDLYSYYGAGDIFGTDYSGGYTENEIRMRLNEAL